MDHARIPAGLRRTLGEILECGNARPFRRYYRWVGSKIEEEAKQGKFRKIAELGAGTAPATRLRAKERRQGDPVALIPCDMYPDVDAYRRLEKTYPGLVTPIFTAVDFSRPYAWESDTLLVLSGTFHHVLPAARLSTLEALITSGRRIVICEPLQNRWSSLGYVWLSIVPALLLPLMFMGRPGRLRRMLWCWLIPVAPLMFWWDGWVSCLRQWDAREWHVAADRLGLTMRSFEARTFSIAWCLKKVRAARARRGRPSAIR
jgi:hypothetical protein